MRAITAEGEAIVLAAIVDCKAADVELLDAHKRLKAVKVGSIELPKSGEIRMLRDEGRRHVGRIASTMDVEVRHDVYSSSAPRTFGGHFGQTGGGNYAAHG